MELSRSGCAILSILLGAFALLAGLFPMTSEFGEFSAAPPEASTGVAVASFDILNPAVQPSEFFSNPQDFPPELIYYMAWSMMARMSLPALEGQRGVPDPNKPFGAPGLTVWETWKGMDEVYLSDGSTPAPWDSPLPPKLLVDTQMIDGQTFTSVSSGLDVRYEERINQDTFDYLISRNLYNRDGQAAFFNAPANTPLGAPIDFPDPSFEIKASWIVLGPGDDPSLYHTSEGFIIDQNGDQQAVTFGLTGFHFTSKITPPWFWATFENVNNAEATHAGNPVQPIPQIVQMVNDDVHQQIGTSNVWSNYVLRGIQAQFTEPVVLLANTQIETEFQSSSSCITCHLLSSVGSTSDGRMPFFSVDASGVEGWYGDPTTITFVDAFGESFFFDPFQQGFVDSNGNLRFKQLDFLWSMRRAQWQSQ